MYYKDRIEQQIRRNDEAKKLGVPEENLVISGTPLELACYLAGNLIEQLARVVDADEQYLITPDFRASVKAYIKEKRANLYELEKNIRRDRRTRRSLRRMGWSVLRVWEHDLNNH